ncbi:MAG: inositol monophosphatase family protein [Sulfolobales archaeon]|nr:hypothetical protein [Sulfolobales archaeon]MCX8208246.1 hypothetical protein [Sulfolobales archaeon]MDW8010265.1 inositol monophosphatase family protein [Sulfolobales archaeon]
MSRSLRSRSAESGVPYEVLEEAIVASLTRASMYLKSAFVSKKPVGLGRGGDVSREFDVVVEKIVYRTLSDYLGDVKLVSEEIGSAGEGSWLAVLDPVDGSANFEAGIPLASISLGISRNRENAKVGDIEAAAVAEVFRDVIYYYDKSSGFKTIGARIERRPSPSNIVLGYFESLESFKPYLNFSKISGLKPRLRSLGSAALDVVYVALGIAMGFVDARARLRNVDLAPSLAIAKSLGAGAYLCSGADATSITIREVARVECVVVGYDEKIARELLKAASSELSP